MLIHLTRSTTPDAQTFSTGLNAQGTGKSHQTRPLLSLKSRAKSMDATINVLVNVAGKLVRARIPLFMSNAAIRRGWANSYP